MSKKIQIAITMIAFLLSVILKPAYADEALTLEKSLSLAFENNPRVIEARKTIDAAKGDLITARTFANPEVEFEIGGLKKNEEGKRKTNLDSFEVRQGFDPPGVRGLKSKIAKNEILIQQESLKSIWSQVYAEVREVYSQVIIDKKKLELAQDNLDILRQFFSRVQQRFQSGQALKNDVQRAKIELLDAENAYLAVEKELKINKAKLNLLLGRAMDTLFEIEEELKDEELQLDLQELTQVAFSKSPLIKSEDLTLNSKNANLTKEQLNRLPSPFLGFKRTNEDYDNDYAAVIGFSVPLWNLNQGEVKKAQAEKDAQAVRTEAVKREVSFNVFEAYLNAELAHRQLELLKKSLEEANELLRLANLRYSEGEIDFINFLDQTRTSTQAKVKYYEGLFSLNKAVNELEKTIYASIRKEGYLQ
jgi:cobalt-zinc-cadmium efflux system outer membrane protein